MRAYGARSAVRLCVCLSVCPLCTRVSAEMDEPI